MKGEVEFRFALAIPLTFAIGVITFGLGAPTWLWVITTLAGAAAGRGLLQDGWRRDEQRNDYLVELLAIGKAKSPTFERLAERAQQQSTAAVGGSHALDEAAASEVMAASELPQETPRQTGTTEQEESVSHTLPSARG